MKKGDKIRCFECRRMCQAAHLTMKLIEDSQSLVALGKVSYITTIFLDKRIPNFSRPVFEPAAVPCVGRRFVLFS
jgi:hypothetical protein